MFDFSKMLSGVEVFFGNTDYNRTQYCNEYYRKLLKGPPPAVPACLQGIDEEALTARLQENPKAPMSKAEHGLIMFRRAGAQPPVLDNSARLQHARALASTYGGNPEVVFGLAQILIRADQYTEAMHYLERTIHLSPNHVEAWVQTSIIAALANDHGKAMQSARRALKLGQQANKIVSRAYVFSMLLLGMPSKTELYSSSELFDNVKFEDIQERSPKPEATYHYQPNEIADAPIIMFACDSGYFLKFGHDLMRSLTKLKDRLTLHVHIVNATEDDLAWLDGYIRTYNDQIIVSLETQTKKRWKGVVYLTANRFVHAPDFIRRFERPYLIVDTDSLLNDAAMLMSFLDNVKKPTFFLSEENPIWDRVSAPFVYFPNNDISLKMASEVQNYLLRSFCTSTGIISWYVDQLALFGACLKFSNQVNFVPNKMASCIEYSDSAIFWTLSNDKNTEKYNALAGELLEEFPDP